MCQRCSSCAAHTVVVAVATGCHHRILQRCCPQMSRGCTLWQGRHLQRICDSLVTTDPHECSLSGLHVPPDRQSAAAGDASVQTGGLADMHALEAPAVNGTLHEAPNFDETFLSPQRRPPAVSTEDHSKPALHACPQNELFVPQQQAHDAMHASANGLNSTSSQPGSARSAVYHASSSKAANARRDSLSAGDNGMRRQSSGASRVQAPASPRRPSARLSAVLAKLPDLSGVLAGRAPRIE